MKPHSWPRLVFRTAAGAALALAGVAALLSGLSLAGLHFHGASAGWQLALAAVLPAVIGAALAWPRGSVALAAATHFRDHRRRWPWLERVLLVTAAAGLLLLWLGPVWPPPEPIGDAVVVVRGESPARLFASGAAPVEPDDHWQAMPPPAELGKGLKGWSARGAGGCEPTWVKIGNLRWPIILVPADDGFDPRPLRPEPGAKLDPFDGPVERLGDVGFKPVVLEAWPASVAPLRLFHWAALPCAALAQPDKEHAEHFAILVATQSDPVDDKHVLPQVPVLVVRHADGVPVYVRLCGDLDLSGASGLQQGTGWLDQARAFWRARRFAAPGGFVVVPDAPPQRRSVAWQLPADRWLPAPLSSADPQRRHEHEFPAHTPLAVGVMLALTAVGVLWTLRRPR
jgi:hypothetical protein